jgi:hypothetical protein
LPSKTKEAMQKNQLKQTTNHLLMVRPANFGFNPETAESNAFQRKDTDLTSAEIKNKAVQEFDNFVKKLTEVGVDVTVVQDSTEPIKTDAVFPNNWVTFHEDGMVILYPMLSQNRRLERQNYVLEAVTKKFFCTDLKDLSAYEQVGKILEGTGSMIFDRVHRLVYACLSPRTNSELLDIFCEWTGFEKVVFYATDSNVQEIYHTNVMMAMGDSFVVICMDSVRDAAEKAMLLQNFQKTNKTIIDISMPQMQAFAGNMLQVENADGKTFLVMSEQAFKILTKEQIAKIEEHTTILHSPLYTIEQFGGGSARCMMAEIFCRQRI